MSDLLPADGMQKRYRRYTDAVHHIRNVLLGSTDYPTILPLLRTFPNLCSIRIADDLHIEWHTQTDAMPTTAVSTIPCDVFDARWDARVAVANAFLPVEWVLLWRPVAMRISKATAPMAKKAVLANGDFPLRLKIRALDTDALEAILNIASALAGRKNSSLHVGEPDPYAGEGHWNSQHTLAYLDRAASITRHLGVDAFWANFSDIRRLQSLATRVRTLSVWRSVWPPCEPFNGSPFCDPVPSSASKNARLENIRCRFILRLEKVTKPAVVKAMRNIESDLEWLDELAKTLVCTFGPRPVIYVDFILSDRSTVTAPAGYSCLTDYPHVRPYARRWRKRIREAIKALASEHQHAQSPGWRRHRKGVALV